MSNLVTFEQAKKLKELGFSVLCASYYEPMFGKDLFGGCNSDHNTLPRWEGKRYSAPTVSSALDWIRENKGVVCSIWFDRKVIMTKDQNKEHVLYYFGVFYSDVLNDINHFTERADTHPLAESALLTAVLEYLTEKEK